MSLRRVPPNLLVGQGAVDYAFEIGVPVLPPDALVSWAARERWIRWRKDLLAVQAKKKSQAELEPTAATDHPVVERLPESYTNHMAGTWNESQPYSPHPTAATSRNGSSDLTGNDEWPPMNVPTDVSLGTPVLMSDQLNLPRGHTHPPNRSPFIGFIEPSSYAAHSPLACRSDHDGHSTQGHDETENEDAESIDPDEWDRVREYDTSSPPSNVSPWSASPISGSGASLQNSPNLTPQASSPIGSASGDPSLGEDYITDTVGAIAIDSNGNIAAGSSSGGIGMKHKGRAGPAALVGIGTHVVPVDAGDKSRTCVATVTSGTGEHMATTMAAGMCAKRIYHCEVKGKDGKVRIADEEAAVRAFVERDFMGETKRPTCLFVWVISLADMSREDHPSVRHSHSAGAIGVMGVKKTKDGAWLHFAHNTDSFVCFRA